MPSETRTPKTMRDRRSRPNRSVPKGWRSEEHTSELQSQSNLVCRLLLEKKKKQKQLPHLEQDLDAGVVAPHVGHVGSEQHDQLQRRESAPNQCAHRGLRHRPPSHDHPST